MLSGSASILMFHSVTWSKLLSQAIQNITFCPGYSMKTKDLTEWIQNKSTDMYESDETKGKKIKQQVLCWRARPKETQHQPQATPPSPTWPQLPHPLLGLHTVAPSPLKYTPPKHLDIPKGNKNQWDVCGSGKTSGREEKNWKAKKNVHATTCVKAERLDGLNIRGGHHWRWCVCGAAAAAASIIKANLIRPQIPFRRF